MIHVGALDLFAHRADRLGAPDADRPDSWRYQALCRNVDPEIFFPDKGTNANEARRICQNCPVQTDCRQEAFDGRIFYGVWGGLSERERRALLNRERVA